MGECASNSSLTFMTSCVSANGTWVADPLNFDNVGESLKTFFVLWTMDEWFSFLSKLSSCEEDQTGHRAFSTFFIVSFIVIMSFIMLNVLMALVIVVFCQEKEKADKFKVLNKSDQECILAVFKEQYGTKATPNGRLRKPVRIYSKLKTHWLKMRLCKIFSNRRCFL